MTRLLTDIVFQMIDTNLVRRSYRVTVMKELFHRLADEGHGTRLD